MIDPVDSTQALSKGNHALIAETVGMRIVQGEFPPGSVLPSEATWASEFQVSRSVVREAIKMLMAKKLLLSRTKIGSRVEPKENWNLLDPEVLSWYMATPKKPDLLLSLQQFRAIIEPEAAALAAMHHSPEQLAAIRNACREMGEAPTMDIRTEADVRFHTAILKATNNEFMMPLASIVQHALKGLFASMSRSQDELLHAQKLHENVVKAIRLKKPDRARKAVRELLLHSDTLL